MSDVSNRVNGDGICEEELVLIKDICRKLPTREECNRAKQLLELAEMAIEKLERALLLEHQLNAPHRREDLWNTASAWVGMVLFTWGVWLFSPAAAPIACGVLLVAGVVYSQSGGEV